MRGDPSVREDVRRRPPDHVEEGSSPNPQAPRMQASAIMRGVAAVHADPALSPNAPRLETQLACTRSSIPLSELLSTRPRAITLGCLNSVDGHLKIDTWSPKLTDVSGSDTPNFPLHISGLMPERRSGTRGVHRLSGSFKTPNAVVVALGNGSREGRPHEISARDHRRDIGRDTRS